MGSSKVIASSKDEDAEQLQALEGELYSLKERLEKNVEDSTSDEIEIEFEELLELEDDYKEENFGMVTHDSIIGISKSEMDLIKDVSEGPEITLPNKQKRMLRHELAHLIDNKINEKEYTQIEPETSHDIKLSPKEAYSIFEELRISSHFDFSENLPRGYSAVEDWEFLTDVNKDGEIDWNDNKPSIPTPHKLGYYAAKTIEEAAYKKHDNRKEAESEVRKKLLETTTVDGLLSEVSEAHKELGHPFYLDVLDQVSTQVAEKEENGVKQEIAKSIAKYDEAPSIGVEEFYRDHALVQSYEDIYGDSTEASEELRQHLKQYRKDKNSDEYISNHIMIDDGLETSDEYKEWLP